jgi:hypothetical protein
VPRVLPVIIVAASILGAPGVGAQSRGFGTASSAPSSAPRVGNAAARSTTLRLIPRTSTAAAPAIGFVRITTGIDGGQANDASFRPWLSGDGRYVAFESDASNLVSGDTNGLRDIFVYDRATGQTTRESLGPGGVQSNDGNASSDINGDGRFVVFRSTATNLVSGGTQPFTRHAYVRDRQLGTTTVADVSTNGMPGNANAIDAAISSDGRFVAFSSLASNLVAGDTNQCEDVFVHDMFTGATERASVSSIIGAEASCVLGSGHPAISADGRFVAFDSDARNFSAVSEGVYVRDRATGVTTLESIGPDGRPLSSALADSISGDGRFVLFRAVGTAPGIALYLRDRAAGQTLGPVAGVVASHLSGDGRFVSYANDVRQAFVVDLATGSFIPIANDAPDITAVAGGTVAFSSQVAQEPGDTNRTSDIYVATATSAAVPGVPRDLAATVFGSTLTLTWNPPVSGDPPAAYVIEAGSMSGGVDVANFSTGSTATTFSATVAGGGTFFIRVRAANAAGVSPPSNEILVTIGSALSPPGPPIALSSSVSGSTVTLTWARPLSGGAATTYIVDAGSAPGVSNLASIDTQSAAPSFVAPGVGPGTYFVRVRGANAGGAGPPSNEIAVVVR